MKNPFRDEAAAFHLVFLSLGYFGLIALAAWISTTLGIVVFVLLTAGALVALRGGRARPEPQPVERPLVDDTRRVLVVANETVGGEELLRLVHERASAPGTAVHVVCPALNSRVRTWTSDEDGARAAAQARLDASVERLAAAGVAARGEIGDGDPVQAVEDALRGFPADEIVLSTHPPGRSNWLERGVVGAVRDRFDVPVTHVVVDLERQAAAPADRAGGSQGI
ncbi:MAG TPA: universal stress protein [Gaiella sp.]